MVDLQSQYLRLKESIDKEISKVITASSFINGEAVLLFEQNFSSYLNSLVATCGNGTDALYLALKALSLPENTEVLVPSFTFIASVEAICNVGLIPVFVDVGDDFLMDLSDLESKITSNTVAVLPVNLYGQNCNLEKLQEIASKHGLRIIEDCAQSIGSKVFINDQWLKTGVASDIATTSFFPSKNLGCFGDGGAVYSSDQELIDQVKLLANHGTKIKYQSEVVGINSRLDSIQAAVLHVKLQQLDDFIARRQKVASIYDSYLGDLQNVLIPKRVTWSTHAFHQYTIRVQNGKRDLLKQKLQDAGIPTMIYYPNPVHLQTPYISFGQGINSLPNTELFTKEVLSLPIHTEMSDEDVTFIANKVIEIINDL